ncbi:MAG TPA: DUF5985 family protein [Humisphaera sp.]
MGDAPTTALAAVARLGLAALSGNGGGVLAPAVYALCALTCVACAALLARGYLRSRARLLLWAALCFVGLAANNVLLYVDKVLLATEADLSVWRTGTALAGLGVLLFGLIWDSD